MKAIKLNRSNQSRAIFIVAILAIGVVYNLIFNTPIPHTDDPNCIKSFHEFAYEGPSDRDSFTPVSPLSPWQKESPIVSLEDQGISAFNVEISRVINDQEEIWLVKYYPHIYENPVVVVYNTATQQWEVISAQVGDTELLVQHLFATSDGTVWGETRWDWDKDYPGIDQIPALSKFNEQTRRFEFAEGAPEIQLLEDRFHDGTKIVLDNADIFWIFAGGNQGLYRYDSVAQTAERLGDLPSDYIRDTALAPDGSIYFEVEGNYWYLRQDTLFRFVPATGEITLVDVPDEQSLLSEILVLLFNGYFGGAWPSYGTLVVDHTGRLWLGAIGYRDVDNSWHLIYPPYLKTHGDQPAQTVYATPHIMLESSDGRLWYQKDIDTTGWGEGTAWYDPATGEGCMFTTIHANMIEDSQQQLWIAAGYLYKYPLNP